MVRSRDETAFAAAKERLIEVGLELFRAKSFAGVGISDILKRAGVPKGSFYHYFESKDAFGLAVADTYHELQMKVAMEILSDPQAAPFGRLEHYFSTALNDFDSREYAEGCLMCNLSVELGDQNASFQERLSRQWQELSGLIASSMDQSCLDRLGLAHLSESEAADQLINAWAGALTRMKAERSGTPLRLFMKTHFKRGH